MRIISGAFRGRRLNPPGNLPVRPTTDMAREALFSILYSQYDFENLHILDLFCGTGAIALESISRGCPVVCAVDANIKCIEFIKKTAAEWKASGLQAVKADAFRFIEKSSKAWDIIFADPPYIMKESLQLPQMIAERKLLKKGGRLIIEHPSDLVFRGQAGFLEQRSYSRVQFSFFNFDDLPEPSQNQDSHEE
jgi:16S rRNA (guanine(966)-N(2))-methyltransferase RsmD